MNQEAAVPPLRQILYYEVRATIKATPSDICTCIIASNKAFATPLDDRSRGCETIIISKVPELAALSFSLVRLEIGLLVPRLQSCFGLSAKVNWQDKVQGKVLRINLRYYSYL